MDIITLFGVFLGVFQLFLLSCFFKLKSKGLTTKENLTAVFAAAVMIAILILVAVAAFAILLA